MAFQVRVTGFVDETEAEKWAEEVTDDYGYSTFVEEGED